MTVATTDAIEQAMRGLVFAGTHPGTPADDGAGLSDRCAREVDRLRERLSRRDRDLGSCLVLDVCFDPTAVTAASVAATLATTLPSDCRPCLTAIPVAPGALDGRGLTLQAVSTADPVRPASTGRFPDVATAGPLVAIGGQAPAVDGDMVTQTTAVMEHTAQLLGDHGLSWDDAVRFNVFYRDEGTIEGWAINAHERARHFTEPGPATTGVPVAELPGTDARIMLRAIMVRGARALGLRTHLWPTGHWDWPFHLPYKHGCACADTMFIGGQVSLTPDAKVIDPGRLDLQAVRSIQNILRVAAEVGKGPEDVLRLVAFYQHQDEDDPKAIETIVYTELERHDVELSLIGLPYLAYPAMVVEIEAEVR